MDKQARAEMLAEGFEAGILCVTGQPAFDELGPWRLRVDACRRAELRSRLGVGPEDLLVLFASTPNESLCGADASNPLWLGYTEHTVLRCLVSALEKIVRRRKAPIVLLIRPHPREEPGPLRRYRGEQVRVLVDDRDDGREAILTADLVTGMVTALLVQACLLGCKVVSLQPGLSGADLLPTNRSGASRAVYREEDVEAVIEEALFGPQPYGWPSTEAHRCPPGAAERVAALIESLVRRPDAALQEECDA